MMFPTNINTNSTQEKCQETKISKSLLLDYIDHQEIAFQFGDGLMTFTRPTDGTDTNALKDTDEISQLKSFVVFSDNIQIVSQDELIDDELGFAEFAAWSDNQDVLLLVDQSLLICMPSSHLCKILSHNA